MVFLRLFHMHLLISALLLGIISLGCQTAGSPTPSTDQQEKSAIVKDTVAAAVYLAPYDELEFKKKEVLTAASGTKAVLFNSTGTRLYDAVSHHLHTFMGSQALSAGSTSHLQSRCR